jgi:hypothetical protein
MSTFIARTFSRIPAVLGFVYRLVFGMLALCIGTAIVLWVCYNLFIERQPEFSGNSVLPSFGIGPVMIAVGVYWLRSLRRSRQKDVRHDT